MPAFVVKAADVHDVRAPWNAKLGGYQLTITNLDTSQTVSQLPYANPNVPIPDLAEGRYRFSLVALDQTTGQPIPGALVEVDQVIAQPVVSMPVSISVVPA